MISATGNDMRMMSGITGRPEPSLEPPDSLDGNDVRDWISERYTIDDFLGSMTLAERILVFDAGMKVLGDWVDFTREGIKRSAEAYVEAQFAAALDIIVEHGEASPFWPDWARR